MTIANNGNEQKENLTIVILKAISGNLPMKWFSTNNAKIDGLG